MVEIPLIGTRRYGKNIRAVVAYREALDLDHPKFVPGEDSNDVVSNFSYA